MSRRTLLPLQQSIGGAFGTGCRSISQNGTGFRSTPKKARSTMRKSVCLAGNAESTVDGGRSANESLLLGEGEDEERGRGEKIERITHHSWFPAKPNRDSLSLVRSYHTSSASHHSTHHSGHFPGIFPSSSRSHFIKHSSAAITSTQGHSRKTAHDCLLVCLFVCICSCLGLHLPIIYLGHAHVAGLLLAFCDPCFSFPVLPTRDIHTSKPLFMSKGRNYLCRRASPTRGTQAGRRCTSVEEL